jgi:serine/threonine-protein kinase
MPEKGDLLEIATRFQQKVYEEKYGEALEILSSTSIEAFAPQYWFYPKALLTAWVHEYQKEPELARAAYEEAGVFLNRELEMRPYDSRVHSALGIVYAGLGQKKEAIQEGRRGVELMPISVHINGSLRIKDLARIYTMVGEYDEALSHIDYLLTIPTDLSVKRLELDPVWEPLREHPRYQKIIDKYR